MRACFLPTATVTFFEGAPTKRESVPVDAWISGLLETVNFLGYSRVREISSVEVDDVHGRTMVRSRLRETALGRDGLTEIWSDEWMWIVRDRGGLQIGALGTNIVGINTLE